jgi:4-amino-4-deoxy-L-arabinose transferase-like glycosyltransferase
MASAPRLEWPQSVRGFAVVLLLFGATWLAHLATISFTPPSDNLEQLMWIHSLEWGYYKHPPLPTWLLWLVTIFLGNSALAPAALGAACTLLAFLLYWIFLREVRGARYASVATLACLCITFYNGRLNYYNHNIVMLLLVTASALFAYRAFDRRQIRWWSALGITLALGSVSKYQIAVTMLSLFAFWLHQRGWRDALHWKGVAIVSSLVLLCFAPHLYWLSTHDFAPFTYAKKSSLGAQLGIGSRVFNSFNWLADLLANRALPAWLFLLSLLFVKPFRQSRGQFSQSGNTLLRDRAFALILCWGVIPLGFMLAIGLGAGADMQLHWGTAFLPFAVAGLMEMFYRDRDWEALNFRHVVMAFLTFQVILFVISYLTSPIGLPKYRSGHWQGFDSVGAARKLEPIAAAALGGPVRVIAGKQDISDALALRMASRPVVLIEGRLDWSPWVSQALIDRCGAIEINTEKALAAKTNLAPEFPNIYWIAIAPKLGADAQRTGC